MQKLEFEIPLGINDMRIDKAIALETHMSRSVISKMFESKDVTLNGKVIKRSEKVSSGDVVTFVVPEVTMETVVPQDIDLDIVFEDDHIVVINKPEGLVVHPGAGNPDGTIANALVNRYPDIVDVGQRLRPGIVHRLDAGTSGILVAAKTQEAYLNFVEMFKSHEVDRKYLALIWGKLEVETGLIDAPIGRSQTRATKMAIRQDGKEARTQYQVIEHYDSYDVSLLDVSLETGRTHQIRVHFSSINHPIVGDKTYGGYRQNLECPRPFLHAQSLHFTHPITEKKMDFSVSMPNDLVGVLKQIESD